jgi:hypothetical protein
LQAFLLWFIALQLLFRLRSFNLVCGKVTRFVAGVGLKWGYYTSLPFGTRELNERSYIAIASSWRAWLG